MNNETSVKPFKISLYAKILALLMVAFYMWLYSFLPVTAESTGYLVGRVLIAVVLSYGAARLAYRANRKSSFTPSITFLVVMGISMIASVTEVQKRLKANSESEKQILKGFITQIFDEGSKLAHKYSAAVTAAGAETLLEPKRLAEDKGLIESEKVLSKLNELRSQYQKDTDTYLASFEGRIQTLPISQESRDGMLKGFRERQAEKKKVFADFFRLEKEIVDTSSQLVALLKKNEGKFKFGSDTLQFEEDATLEEYNRYIDKIQAVAAQLTKVGADSDKQVSETMKKMDDLLGAK